MRPAERKQAVILCSFSSVLKDFSWSVVAVEVEEEEVAVKGNEDAER